MVMDCDAQLATDHRFNQGNVEYRSVSTTEVKRQSLQDQVRPSKIQLHGGWNPRDDLGAQSAEESTGKIGQRPIIPSTFPSTFPSESPFSVPDPPSCFCIGEHTCVPCTGPSSTIPTPYGNFDIPTAQPEADDSIWMDSYVNTNACAGPDAER